MNTVMIPLATATTGDVKRATALRVGGFTPGLVAPAGCCGETADLSTTGCCGEPRVPADTSASACCGVEPARAIDPSTQAATAQTGCCGGGSGCC